MAFADLPLVDMLKTRMRWLESRQKILSENIANTNAPGYRERDLKTLDFDQLVAGGDVGGSIVPVTTNPHHIAIGSEQEARFGAGRQRTFETTPAGNSVDVEDEMMKVAETQQDYQVATMLYSKSLDMLKLAVK